jgi:DNA-binding SARP family transcriptional activator
MHGAYRRVEPSEPIRLEFRCLGAFTFRSCGEWRSGPARAAGGQFLQYLASHPHAAVSREKLADVLWPDLDADQSAHRLHLAASGARGTLRAVIPAVNPILFSDGSYSWNPALTIERDTDQLERSFEDGSEAALMSGVRAYTGDFLTGETADWVMPMRLRYEHMFVTMLESLARRALDAQDYARATGFALDLIAVDRAHELATQLAMICFAKSGRRARALAEYDCLERYLRKWLGVPPTTETQRLRAKIRGGDTDLTLH